MQFIISMSFTDQGIRTIKDAPKRTQAARELAKKLGVEIKHIYLTSGENDLVSIVETSSGDNIAKMALALGSAGNVRTRISRVRRKKNISRWFRSCPKQSCVATRSQQRAHAPIEERRLHPVLSRCAFEKRTPPVRCATSGVRARGGFAHRSRGAFSVVRAFSPEEASLNVELNLLAIPA